MTRRKTGANNNKAILKNRLNNDKGCTVFLNKLADDLENGSVPKSFRKELAKILRSTAKEIEEGKHKEAEKRILCGLGIRTPPKKRKPLTTTYDQIMAQEIPDIHRFKTRQQLADKLGVDPTTISKSLAKEKGLSGLQKQLKLKSAVLSKFMHDVERLNAFIEEQAPEILSELEGGDIDVVFWRGIPKRLTPSHIEKLKKRAHANQNCRNAE